jgi:hypothetical protein
LIFKGFCGFSCVFSKNLRSKNSLKYSVLGVIHNLDPAKTSTIQGNHF